MTFLSSPAASPMAETLSRQVSTREVTCSRSASRSDTSQYLAVLTRASNARTSILTPSSSEMDSASLRSSFPSAASRPTVFCCRSSMAADGSGMPSTFSSRAPTLPMTRPAEASAISPCACACFAISLIFASLSFAFLEAASRSASAFSTAALISPCAASRASPAALASMLSRPAFMRRIGFPVGLARASSDSMSSALSSSACVT
mmetsp:Transcript_55219/g.125558  ORF Transcript_55219/g.125558 Transcript_55219/m.125558 type:complete len:205 (+) Transcript_55219:811-1425(+)